MVANYTIYGDRAPFFDGLHFHTCSPPDVVVLLSQDFAFDRNGGDVLTNAGQRASCSYVTARSSITPHYGISRIRKVSEVQSLGYKSHIVRVNLGLASQSPQTPCACNPS